MAVFAAKSTCPRVSHLGHSLFFDYCGLDFGCCAESVVEDDCDFISTLHSDLCDQLADDAVFKVLYIRTRCGYLFEESVESAFDIQRGANLGFFDFDDLAEFGDVCVDTLEFSLEFLLVTSLCTYPYDSHHIVLLLLFASTVTQFFSNCRIRFIRYDGTSAEVGTRMNIIKDVNIEEPLPRLIEKAKQFLSIQLREFTALDPKTGQFKTQPEYPEFAWLEGIVNAVTHREYALSGNYIRVTMYDDRLEILSPGKLPNLVTVDNIQETRFSRNPQIARVLTEFGFVRELNEGVKRIYADMKEQNLESPIYTETEQAVTLILKNNIEQRNIKRKEVETTQGATQGTTQGTTQAIQESSVEGRILALIKENPKISQSQMASKLGIPVNSVKYYINKMRHEQHIVREGTSQKGKWIIL